MYFKINKAFLLNHAILIKKQSYPINIIKWSYISKYFIYWLYNDVLIFLCFSLVIIKLFCFYYSMVMFTWLHFCYSVVIIYGANLTILQSGKLLFLPSKCVFIFVTQYCYRNIGIFSIAPNLVMALQTLR